MPTKTHTARPWATGSSTSPPTNDGSVAAGVVGVVVVVLVIVVLIKRFNTTVRRTPNGEPVASRHGHPHAVRYTITSDPDACVSRDAEGHTNLTPNCDICGEKSWRVFSCVSNCDYDECVECHNNGGPAPPPTAAPVEGCARVHTCAHPLEVVIGKPPGYASAAQCNGCGAAPLRTTHHCAVCKFDLCDRCITRASRAPATGARHAHALVRTVGRLRKHGALARCDTCAALSKVTFFCAQCDFDQCEACHSADGTALTIRAPEAVAGSESAALTTRAPEAVAGSESAAFVSRAPEAVADYHVRAPLTVAMALR